MKTRHVILSIIALLSIVLAINYMVGAKTQPPIETNEPALENTGSQTAVDEAIEWLISAPTYGFDGMENTITVNATQTEETVNTGAQGKVYTITIDFQCRQPGYGDRSSMMLEQVITQHQATITVEQGEVTQAIIDQTWDEVNQVYLTD